MKSKVFLGAALIVVLGMVMGCMRVRFIEPKGAKVTMQVFSLIWTEPQEIPVPPDEAEKFPGNSSRKIRIILPDGYTIYGRMELKDEQYFTKYGAIPIRLTKEEVIDPIVNEDKVITYVIYEPWIGGKPPEKKRFVGLLEYVGGAISMVGTLWLGEHPEKGEEARKRAIEERGQKVVNLYEGGEVPSGAMATCVGVGEDPVKAAKRKGKILAILRLGNRKRSKW